ncbi:uncharacterized protein LOC115727956 isoform X2 [Rhodamnia argentea]|uniref:Uncharacterized protein LOC115727956 isoform X2 n=1 Tax=Rhodamnia argentea TaxID=178133 RepID=A0ABM3HKW6_9MYRT|nr:uncharacterized protein LOC115727956 isoform X2 [Rhodamnia argentea]
MYVTRPLSMYWKHPEALSEAPPVGPGSGYLVIQDEEAQGFCCFGLCKDSQLYDFPFPQNKDLTVRYTEHHGESTTVHNDGVFMIPVVGQPLSSNQYYAIRRHGKHKGEAHGNSREEDKGTCLCFRYVKDKKPSPLDPEDIYQQFVIDRRETMCGFGGFHAKSVAVDGYPPRFLKRKGWTLRGKTPKNFLLDDDALGVDDSRRSKLPSLDISIDRKRSDPVVVGKWYCPFMFVKDGEVGEQIKTSPFYEMTLQQRWEQVHACENYGNEGSDVEVDVLVQKEAIAVFGEEAGKGDASDGAIWFRSNRGAIGLSMAIVERMRWEEERVGWVNEGEKRVRELMKSGSNEGWKRFGCYVLVESFVLKRMGGTLVLAYDFKHTHQVRSKWE